MKKDTVSPSVYIKLYVTNGRLPLADFEEAIGSYDRVVQLGRPVRAERPWLQS